MKTHIVLLVAAIAVLLPVLPAQTTYQHTLPFGYETTDGTYACYPSLAGAGPFYAAPGDGNCRWQWIYGWNQFFHQCPILISQIDFRRSTDLSLVGTSYTSVTITMASLAPAYASHTAVSGTFANNLGPDQVVVYSGPLTIPAHTAVPTTPAPWLINIPLQIPFAFDPVQKRDFIIDLQVTGGTATPGNFQIDGAFPHPGVAQNGNTQNPLSATSDWSNPDAGAIALLTYQLGNPLHFDLILSTTGSGTGDLNFGYANIPAGTTHGYTLLTTVAASTYGAPFGRGPLMGIYPDNTTWNVIIPSPASLGSPFHWVLPASGLFPETSISVGAGVFSFLAGAVWEGVGVALSPTGLLGISPPRQLAW